MNWRAKSVSSPCTAWAERGMEGCHLSLNGVARHGFFGESMLNGEVAAFVSLGITVDLPLTSTVGVVGKVSGSA